MIEMNGEKQSGFVGWLIVCFTAYHSFSGHLTPNLVILIKVLNNSVEYEYSYLIIYWYVSKTVLFQTIQFTISTQFRPI